MRDATNSHDRNMATLLADGKITRVCLSPSLVEWGGDPRQALSQLQQSRGLLPPQPSLFGFRLHSSPFAIRHSPFTPFAYKPYLLPLRIQTILRAANEEAPSPAAIMEAETTFEKLITENKVTVLLRQGGVLGCGATAFAHRWFATGIRYGL